MVVPALNEAACLPRFFANLEQTLRATRTPCEIILVDDGSTDHTRQLMNAWAADHPGAQVVTHARPRGFGAAIRSGFMAARGDALTWLPADGENSLADTLKQLPLLTEHAIIIPVIGNREIRPRVRRLISSVYRAIINAAFGLRLNNVSGNLLLRRSVFTSLSVHADGFFFSTELLVKAVSSGAHHYELPIMLAARTGGRSKALSWRSLRAVTRDFCRLLIEVRFKRSTPTGAAHRQ